MNFSGKDVISIRDFSRKEIDYILKVAKELEENPNRKLLDGYVLGTLFFEPSTRTRLSFTSAMMRLGGNVLGFDSEVNTSRKKGETVFDTIKMIEGYADVIVMRHYLEGASKLAADASRVPVLNAGDGANQHPTQTLLDLYTIKKVFGKLDGIKIGFVGDLKYGRTVHSLAKALVHYDAEMYFVSPGELKMPKSILEDFDSKKIKYHEESDLQKIVKNFDVLYMTRIQKERFADPMEYEKVKDIYRISKKTLLPYCKKEMKIMHPLPRVNEIHPNLDSTPNAIYFEQAHNGIPVRQALLGLVLGRLK
ncbi:MAG: aspartate carbamoyltransferase [bacterium]